MAVPLLQSEQLLSLGVRHGFTTRAGGVSEEPFDTLNLNRAGEDNRSHVDTNYARVAEALAFSPGALFEATQVHGHRVLDLGPGADPLATRDEQADALIARNGEPVGVRVADCLPLLLFDRASGAVAAVHAGWRGLVGGVVERAVRGMGSATPGDLVAAIGPHIRQGAFEVGPEVAEQIQGAAPGVEVIDHGRARPHADLALAVRAKLEALGVDPHRIDDVGGCTHGEPERFFSYRRDGSRSGRQMGIIVARGPRP